MNRFILLLMGVWACAAPAPGTDGGDDGNVDAVGDTDIVDSDEPDTDAPVTQVAGFDVGPLGYGESDPVAGWMSDGTLVTAAIEDGQLMMLIGEGSPQLPAFGPADGATAVALAMGAGETPSAIHIAWVVNGDVFYTWTNAALETSEVVKLNIEPAAEPNLVVSDNETVVSWINLEGPPQIHLRRAAMGGGFGEEQVVNPECCDSPFEFNNWGASAASMAFGPDGRLHLVWEWMNDFDTVVEYFFEQEEGGFSAPVQIAYAAFAPCPALAVDDDGAHVTYLLYEHTDVMYAKIVDGELQPPESVYSNPYGVNMALMARTPEGEMWLAIHENLEQGPGIRWAVVPMDDEPMAIVHESYPTQLALTGRSGGLSVRNGRVAIPIRVRTDDLWTVQIAVSTDSTR